MSVSITLLSESEATESAVVWFFTLVHAQMVFHIAQLFESSITESADQSLIKSTSFFIGPVLSAETVVASMLIHNFLRALAAQFKVRLLKMGR